MDKKRFCVLDPDPIYVDRFIEYLQRKPNFLFSVIGFTGVQELRGFLEANAVDVVLMDEDCWHDTGDDVQREMRERIPCLILLTDRRRSGEAMNSICRYQSMEKLLPEILRYYEETVPPEKPTENRTQIDAFYSPSGRCGKTTCARLLGTRLSEQCGRNVLYMNLEAVSGRRVLDAGGREGGHSLSDLLYYRQTDGGCRKLQSLTGAQGALSVLEPVVNPEDLWQLSDEELQAVLLEIRDQGIYDSVILDVGADRNPMTVLAVCRRVFLMDGDGEFGRDKMDQFLGYAEQSLGAIPENWHRIRPPHMAMLEDRAPGTRCMELEDWLEKEWLSWDQR